MKRLDLYWLLAMGAAVAWLIAGNVTAHAAFVASALVIGAMEPK